jgi:transcriptional antiterminator NusG
MSVELDNWYVLFVLTGEEDKVKERLNYRLSDDFSLYVPKRRIRERKGGVWTNETKVLFPGYVLLNGEMDVQTYYNMKNVPNLLRLLRSGKDFISLDNSEISVLSKLIGNDEVIGFSSVLMENGRVRVIDGPLYSLEGHIASIDHRKGRAKVRLNFLGEERTVDLGVTILEPA